MAKERNPFREVAIAMAIAVVFAGGLIAYISSQAPKSTPSLLVSTSAEPRAYTRGDDARRIADAFVQQLSMAHHEEAYRLMAGAYRQTTPFSSFQSACMGSPFLSSVQKVSLQRTRETVAPGENKGALTATGVMTTGSGSVEAMFSFVDDASGLGIINVSIAGTPAFPMGSAAVPAKSAAGKPTKKP